MEEPKFGTAVILAGGKSSRMGFDKQLIMLDGESLVKRNISKLKTIFDEIIVVTNNPKYYEGLGVSLLRDIYFQKGPLSGIHVALKNAKSQYVYLLACDMPELDTEYVKSLMTRLENKSDVEILIAREGEYAEPFGGFYAKSLCDRVEKMLEGDILSVNALIRSSSTDYVGLHEVEVDREIFLNLNTQDELSEYVEKRRGSALNVISKKEILKINRGEKTVENDSIITEYPFTLFLNGKEFLTLLCTKMLLEYLLVGFLISEGLIDGKDDIEKIDIDEEKGVGYVETVNKTNLMEKLYGKRTLTSGCGKGTVFYNVVDSFKSKKVDPNYRLDIDSIIEVVRSFSRHSDMFLETGGVHSCALSDGKDIVVFADDIGRHNALDKIIGEAIMREIDLSDKVVLTTGRISSEIMIKIAKRGIPAIVSKSAPTKLALEIAEDLNITVIGFARGLKMNIYTNIDRYA